MDSVYPDDLIILGEQITKRMLDRLLMDLRISTNPHLEPKEAEKFLKDLLDRRRALWGPAENDVPLDRAALDSLKNRLKKESNAIKVK